MTWFANLLYLNKEAGINILEATFTLAPLKMPNHYVLEEAFRQYFVGNIVPKLLQNTNLPSQDVAQILNGTNSKISHLFKVSQFKATEEREENKKEIDDDSKDAIAELIKDSKESHVEELVDRLSNLSINIGPTVLSYDELYPTNWANNAEFEERHKNIFEKIKSWPRDKHGKVRIYNKMPTS